MLGLALVRDHALQFLVGFRILLFKLGLLLRQADPEVADLLDRVPELVETDVEVALLFLEVLPLLGV